MIRLANVNDMKNIFELANDDIARKYSFNKSKIKWEDHVEWFNEKIKDKNYLFYVVEQNEDFLGYVRFEIKDKEAIISINLKESSRGKGLGTKVVVESSKLAFRSKKIHNIIAYISEKNELSKKLFLKCGFVYDSYMFSNNEKFLKFKKGWETVEFENVNFNSFKLDNYSLWWFFKRMYEYKMFPSYVENSSFKMKSSLKLISLNEKFKIFLRNNKEVEKSSVLFFTYAQHLKNGKLLRVNNLYDELAKDEQVNFDLLSTISNKFWMNKDSVYDYLDKDLIQKVKHISQDILSKINLFLDKSGFKIVPEIKFFLSKEFIFMLVLYYYLFKKIITQSEVKSIVITADSHFIERSILAACDNLSVNSYVIQHGFGDGFTHLNGQFLKNNSFFVFGDYFKEILVDKGYDNVHSVGPIVNDDLVNYFGIKPIENKVLLATSVLWEDKLTDIDSYLDTIKKVVQVLRKKGYNVCIKPHPRERNDYNDIFGNEVIVVKNDLYKHIVESNFVVTVTDSVAIEACMLRRKCILVNLTIDPNSLSALSNTGCVNICTIDDFEDSITNLNLKLNEKHLNYLSISDGKSYIRAKNIIKKNLK
tara:strand:+ start:800 stop:2572 length:1773 start_codon:yes stop_codon:yes gene_type:complete